MKTHKCQQIPGGKLLKLFSPRLTNMFGPSKKLTSIRGGKKSLQFIYSYHLAPHIKH